MITLTQFLISMGKSLMFTLSVELLLALVFKADKKTLTVCLWVNLLTNPVVTFTFNLIYLCTHNFPAWYITFTAEALAVLTEGYIYTKTVRSNIKYPFLFSLILNLGSYFGGLAL